MSFYLKALLIYMVDSLILSSDNSGPSKVYLTNIFSISQVSRLELKGTQDSTSGSKCHIPSIAHSNVWNMAPVQKGIFYHISLFYLSWEPTREPRSATPLNDLEWLWDYRWILIWEVGQTAHQGYRLLYYRDDLSSDPQNSRTGCLNSGHQQL